MYFSFTDSFPDGIQREHPWRGAEGAAPQHGLQPERPVPAALLCHTEGPGFQGGSPHLHSSRLCLLGSTGQDHRALSENPTPQSSRGKGQRFVGVSVHSWVAPRQGGSWQRIVAEEKEPMVSRRQQNKGKTSLFRSLSLYPSWQN